MSPVPPEQQLEIVQRFVKNRCFHQPAWDRDDLIAWLEQGDGYEGIIDLIRQANDD